MNTFSTCPHFSLCSGCALSKNFFYPPIRTAVASFFASHSAPLLFESDGFEKTRYKAKLAIRGTSSDPHIGLFKRRSHEVAPIPQCLVHHLSINLAVEQLRRAIRLTHLPPYRENPPQGLLRYAQFFVERTTNRVQLTLVVNAASISPDLQNFCHILSSDPQWHSIWINFQPHATNRIFGDVWRPVHGEPWLWQQIGSCEVAFHPAAFSQVHLSLFDRLIGTIKEWTPPQAHLLELFAGTGAIGLSLLEQCRHIDFIENNPFSALSFRESAKKLPPSLRNRFSYHTESAALPPNPYDLILVDPPRKGLGLPLIDDLNRSTSSKLIYVSCHFDSFKRDAEALSKGGWKLQKGKGFFLFPGTDEVEICAYFEKK